MRFQPHFYIFKLSKNVHTRRVESIVVTHIVVLVARLQMIYPTTFSEIKRWMLWKSTCMIKSTKFVIFFWRHFAETSQAKFVGASVFNSTGPSTCLNMSTCRHKAGLWSQRQCSEQGSRWKAPFFHGFFTWAKDTWQKNLGQKWMFFGKRHQKKALYLEACFGYSPNSWQSISKPIAKFWTGYIRWSSLRAYTCSVSMFQFLRFSSTSDLRFHWFLLDFCGAGFFCGFWKGHNDIRWHRWHVTPLFGFVCLSLVAQTIRLSSFSPLPRIALWFESSAKKAFCSTKWSKSNLNVCFFRRPKLSTSGSTKSDPCPHRIQCFFAMWRNNWESHHSLPLLSSCGSDSEKKNIDLCPCPTSDEVPRLRLVTWKQERQFQRYRGCKWTKRAKALSLDTRVVQLVFLRSNQRMGWTAQS